MRTFIKPVKSTYGAPMGRYTGNNNLDCTLGNIVLRRVYLDNGGYDRGGAYWGIGEPIYEYMDQNSAGSIIRSRDRQSAKSQILSDNPCAKFYN